MSAVWAYCVWSDYMRDALEQPPREHSSTKGAQGIMRRPRPSAPLVAALSLILLLPAPTATAQSQPEFDYEGAIGPAFWGRLTPAFAACSTGRRQSPIDLRNPRRRGVPRIRIDYRPTPLSIENNGHTFEAKPARRQTLSIARKRFRLVQFHPHSPSEHALRGRRYRMELHFVHQAADGERAVLAALVRSGRRNAAFGKALKALPRRAGAERVLEKRVNPYDLLPARRRAFRYAGSLTTPPCTEGIRWNVLQQSVELSSRQLRRYRSLFERNARPLQPPNGRRLTLG